MTALTVGDVHLKLLEDTKELLKKAEAYTSENDAHRSSVMARIGFRVADGMAEFHRYKNTLESFVAATQAFPKLPFIPSNVVYDVINKREMYSLESITEYSGKVPDEFLKTIDEKGVPLTNFVVQEGRGRIGLGHTRREAELQKKQMGLTGSLVEEPSLEILAPKRFFNRYWALDTKGMSPIPTYNNPVVLLPLMSGGFVLVDSWVDPDE